MKLDEIKSIIKNVELNPSEENVKLANDAINDSVNNVLNILNKGTVIAPLTNNMVEKIDESDWYVLLFTYAKSILDQNKQELPYILVTAINDIVEQHPEEKENLIDTPLDIIKITDVLYNSDFDHLAATIALQGILEGIREAQKQAENNQMEHEKN